MAQWLGHRSLAGGLVPHLLLTADHSVTTGKAHGSDI